MKNAILIIFGIIFVCVLSVWLYHNLGTEFYTATIVEKVYVPHTSSSGMAYNLNNGKGGGGVSFVTMDNLEKFTFIVRDSFGGEVHSVEVESQEYAKGKSGEVVTLSRIVWK